MAEGTRRHPHPSERQEQLRNLRLQATVTAEGTHFLLCHPGAPGGWPMKRDRASM